MDRPEIIVFTDGASSGNPGPGGWGVVIYGSEGQVHELGGGEPHTTNNRMEMQGAIEALKWLSQEKEKFQQNQSVRINTDSSYLIHGIQKWIHAWKRKGWKTVEGKDVLNRDLWIELDRLTLEVGKKLKIHWEKVAGHTGIPENERADRIAVSFSTGRPVDLFSGKKEDYAVKPASRSEEGPWYIAFVNGKVERFRSWGECEGRVKGVRGAKFKKVRDAREEQDVLKGWGVEG